MHPSKRPVHLLLFLALLGLAGILFWPFILKDIIQPLALVLWLLLRVLVLSIDQKYIWGALIFLVAVFIFRLMLQDQVDAQSGDPSAADAALKPIAYWRNLIALEGQGGWENKTLRKELVRLMLSLYATKQRTPADFRLYDALKQGEIQLPPRIHAYLFPDKPKDGGTSVKIFIQKLWNAPRKWIRRWSGQEARDQNRMLVEVLNFMETALEIKNDL
jgi:hypothetical protein